MIIYRAMTAIPIAITAFMLLVGVIMFIKDIYREKRT